MSSITLTPTKIKGNVQIPPSKSLAHRAIICASLARGRSIVRNVEYSKDIKATISCMKELGTIIFEHEDYLEIDGTTTFFKNKCEMNCEESGSTLRFMIPISLVDFANVHYTGKGQLGKRPLDVYYKIFDSQKIPYLYKENVLDLYIQGKLSSDEFYIPGDVSSQFISGLLFALPLLEGDSIIHITSPLQSKGYIDLTLQMLNQYGIEVEYKDNDFYVKGNQSYKPCDYTIEGDYSQAAFYLVAGALNNDVVLEGLNLKSLQGDKEAIEILERMGCEFIGADNGYKIVCKELIATDIDASQCPDIIPVIALACANAKGSSRIYNAKRLRIKECDRLSATVEVLKQLGINAIEKDDEMIIDGGEVLGGHVSSYNDHRMAMMEAIASTVAMNDIIIDNKECVKKSYPSFWEHFKMLGGKTNEC
ncbi:MAG: 3-phosphoshikimate 1-carboxyvinyltransferase [Bacilli bacterium]|nr:3-phosphoshikimate 1-carboxyvinyltransferase [Bacilli bacterium]